MDAPDYVIETHNLTKRFPPNRWAWDRAARHKEKTAVQGINLALKQGEIFGLVGSNGAGKTTFIRMLCTLLVPSEGWARVGGHDVVRDEAAVRRLVGLVASNERSFYWRLTGRQNLTFFSDLYHIPRAEAEAWLEELYDSLDLRHIIDMRFDHYSTGQKQRLAIARGLLPKPRVLLMDEPTKGVDPIGAGNLIQIIQERIVQLWNPTILVTSHNLAEIEKLCSRIGLMDKGEIIAIGELEELRRMAGAVETYRLMVARLSGDRLYELAERTGALATPLLLTDNGSTAIEVGFPEGGDGFPRMIRAVVEEGGEVIHCTSVKASFDDVFRTLVAQRGDLRDRD